MNEEAPYVVLVCGSRSLKSDEDRDAVFAELDTLRARVAPRPLKVIDGCAGDGADFFAALWVRERNSAGLGDGQPVILNERFPVRDWERGRIAGKVRNLRMLAEWPDEVLAFWDGRSGGTGHTIQVSRLTGLGYRVVARQPQQALEVDA